MKKDYATTMGLVSRVGELALPRGHLNFGPMDSLYHDLKDGVRVRDGFIARLEHEVMDARAATDTAARNVVERVARIDELDGLVVEMQAKVEKYCAQSSDRREQLAVAWMAQKALERLFSAVVDFRRDFIATYGDEPVRCEFIRAMFEALEDVPGDDGTGDGSASDVIQAAQMFRESLGSGDAFNWLCDCLDAYYLGEKSVPLDTSVSMGVSSDLPEADPVLDRYPSHEEVRAAKEQALSINPRLRCRLAGGGANFHYRILLDTMDLGIAEFSERLAWEAILPRLGTFTEDAIIAPVGVRGGARTRAVESGDFKAMELSGVVSREQAETMMRMNRVHPSQRGRAFAVGGSFVPGGEKSETLTVEVVGAGGGDNPEAVGAGSGGGDDPVLRRIYQGSHVDAALVFGTAGDSAGEFADGAEFQGSGHALDLGNGEGED